MTDRDIPGKTTAERTTVGFSKAPFMNVREDTLMRLGFHPWREHDRLLRIEGQERSLVVYAPKEALTREVVVVCEPIKAFGRTFYRSYVGVIDKPRYLETPEQAREYEQQLRGMVRPENAVNPNELDVRMRDLGGLSLITSA